MNFRWSISVLLSLAFHTAMLYGMYFRQSQKPAPAIPMQVTVAPPQAPPSQEMPAETEQTEPKPAEPAPEQDIQEELKFRPIEDTPEQQQPTPTEPQASEESEPMPEEPQPVAAAEPDLSTPPEVPSAPVDPGLPPAEKPLTPAEYQNEMRQYRQRLLDDFEVNWTQIPELNTRIPHPSMVAAIDSHFGITVIAYGFIDHRPAPPFLIFDSQTGSCTKTDQFDFSRYSNRVKDRSFDPVYQNALERARREHELNSFMKIIGLVPIESDRYFAAKQYQAVKSAGVPLEKVALTSGHYEPNKSGGFSLIIDFITTAENRTLSVQDQEKDYSDPSKR